MGSQCSGGWAEQQALQQLEAQGWRLLDRNWHCRWGELDLVLERQQQLLVAEELVCKLSTKKSNSPVP